jgi:long-chain acyl-CoA synthetase
MSSTVGAALEQRVQQTPKAVAMRYARLGLWDVTTWADLGARVASIAAGMAARGVTEGSVVAIIADNHPDWIAANHAAMSLGASVMAIDPACSLEQLAVELKSASPTMVIAGDEEQYDKTIEAGAGVRTVVLIKTRGMRYLDHQVDLGQNPVITMAQLVDAPSGSEVKAFSNSGAIAVKRGSQRLSHTALIEEAQRLIRTLNLSAADRTFSQRNFADPVEYAASVVAPLFTGHETAIGSGAGPSVMMQEMAQARPTALHVNRDWLTRVHGDIARRSAGVKGLKKLALNRGWKPSAPASLPRQPGLSSIRLLSWVIAVAIVIFLGVSTAMSGWLRFLGMIGVAALIGLVAVLAGVTIRDPLKRRYGLQRLRSTFAADDLLQAEPVKVLGALGIPLVDVSNLGGVS